MSREHLLYQIKEIASDDINDAVDFMRFWQEVSILPMPVLEMVLDHRKTCNMPFA